jgi:hypothetical protein
MRDLDKALSDILEIRSQIAAGTAFRGYGPVTIATTGFLALLTAAAQSLWLAPDALPVHFVTHWIAAAALSAVLIRIEMQGRSRRHHSSLATVMIKQAIEQFLPAGAACIFLAVFLLTMAKDHVWMLPGLWQIFASLGLFASLRFLPRGILFAGGWYFLSGAACLMLASQTHMLSPWLMGIPFAVGQFLMATILYFSVGEIDGEA